MAHHVDAVEQRRDSAGVADVDAQHASGGVGAVAVRGGQHRVDGDHLVAASASAAPTRAPMKPAAPVSRTLMAARTAGDAFVREQSVHSRSVGHRSIAS